MTRSNTQRRSIAKAAKSLEHYDDNGVEGTLVDAITDLKHFVDFYGFDFYELCDRAHGHYLAELSDASDARVTTHGE